MKKLIFAILPVCIIAFTAHTSLAQFEGKVVFESHQVDANGEKKNPDQFTMFVTPQRILLQGDNKYDFVGNIQTEGVLVRLDYEDFVFLTGDNEALKISKADITSMMNMFGNNQNKSNSTPEVNYQRTGETKQINGYSCEKFVFTDEDNPKDHSEIWMTKGLGINWGMMSEAWRDSQQMMGDDLPLDLIFKDGYFPIRVEGYNNGNLTGVVEAKEITKSSIARAMVQIPSGTKVLSFQDYLFQKMSRQ